MEKTILKSKISEYNFLKLFISTMVIQNQGIIINKYELECKLFDFYDDPNFHFLFEDICKKIGIDTKSINLDYAFQSALTFGLLSLVKDFGSVRFIINISKEDAKKINSEFSTYEKIAMKELCNRLSYNETTDKNFILNKKKKECK